MVTTVSYEYTEKLVMIVYNIKNDLTPLWSAHWPGVTCTKFAGGRGKTWIWNLYNSCCLSNNINIYVFAYLLFPVSKVILQQSKLIWYKVTFILYFFFIFVTNFREQIVADQCSMTLKNLDLCILRSQYENYDCFSARLFCQFYVTSSWDIF